MTPTQLRAFATVVRLGSVKPAAAELLVTEAAVSLHIGQLRRELGDKLSPGRPLASPSPQAVNYQVIAVADPDGDAAEARARRRRMWDPEGAQRVVAARTSDRVASGEPVPDGPPFDSDQDDARDS